MTPEDVQKCIKEGRAALVEYAEIVNGALTRAEGL